MPNLSLANQKGKKKKEHTQRGKTILSTSRSVEEHAPLDRKPSSNPDGSLGKEGKIGRKLKQSLKNEGPLTQIACCVVRSYGTMTSGIKSAILGCILNAEIAD